MARCSGRATSRSNRQMQGHAKMIVLAAFKMFCLFFPSSSEAGLYTDTDQIILLTPQTVESVLVNSTAAIVVEFYASWCGHCIAFSTTYKKLARDIKEWKPAVDLSAIDCADESNRKVCTDYGIRGYPTLKFFNAYSKAESKGQSLRAHRDVRGLRQAIIDKLEKHEEPWPPACPPLEPTSKAEIDSFFETNNVQHLALIFEDSKSYIGREVTLDLLQFENIAVRRVLNTEEALVSELGVTDFPSCYLYYPGGNYTRLKVKFQARTFYSYALQRLPGVERSGKPAPNKNDIRTNNTDEPWRHFNASRVYMADLESVLHYSLRVEVSAFPLIRRKELNSLKKYISVLAKYFPGRPVLMNSLKYIDSWLQNQYGNEVSYDAFRAALDNIAQAPDTALPEGVRWVGCQGSQPHFRGYPCGVWTLFHVLTVQALNSGTSDRLEVLTAMREYVRAFFGCRECAQHFESMAQESLYDVTTSSSAVLWLWSRHNHVNNRLAGALSEDPYFPKIQWPSPEMCPRCHTVELNGDHKWDLDQVLSFLKSYFSSGSILTDFLDDESQILEKQREKQALEAKKRIEREVKEATTVNSLSLLPTVQEEEEEEEEEEEGPQDEAVAEDMAGGKNYDTTPWAKPDMGLNERRQKRAHNRPVIVGMRMKQQPEDIVDLDSFVNQHYRAKALAASSRVKRRTLQRKEEQEPAPIFGLGLGLDSGLGMVGLEPMEPDFENQKRKRLQKRELSHQVYNVKAEESYRMGWVSMFSIGFSKVDVSLCVILYFLSSMCLLTMYLFFKNRLRIRRPKVSLL
ncbi:sulfhydryl oxidase 1 [Boleophthalmus pectinirostris]|uniref:sulfhydryl oxidase 1 n=1 Tax=Boleophthalmus pectinirostris TaxID=150288 RepID=UPI000A1C2C73|nr:sulfhydryl oxidase 1 [Boleophthalmus pectinirostris]